MDRDRDGGQRWMGREWRAITFVVEWKVLALTPNTSTPMANFIISHVGGADTYRAAPPPSEGNPTKARLGYGKLQAPLTAQ